MFCENEAEYVIKGSGAPICCACKEVYEAGQESPKDIIEDAKVDDDDDDDDDDEIEDIEDMSR